MRIRKTTPADFPRILALNAEFVRFLSPLTRERLVELDRKAELSLVVEGEEKIAAFLLAFREGAGYDSINYQWFEHRYPSFLYIDRIVIDAAMHGKGLGAALYQQVFAHAAAAGAPWVTCEIDCDPPNPVSDRFHARFGFHEVGRQPVPGGKHVSLQVVSVQPP